MAGPIRKQPGDVWRLKRRTPKKHEDLRGQSVELPIDGELVKVKINEFVEVSLRSTDDEEAKRRFRIADAALEIFWQRASLPKPVMKPLTWDHAAARFGEDAAKALAADGVADTELNRNIVIGEAARIWNEVARLGILQHIQTKG